MKKILIIHPQDNSTTFLSKIYEGFENCSVITNCFISNKELRNQIKSHDIVMMMGHGLPWGLLNPKMGKLIIDYTHIDLLKEKEYNVFIWCHADKFVEHFKLKGLYTGMFISEIPEALHCGIIPQGNDVEKQNNEFSKILNKHLNFDSLKDTFNNLKHEYGLLTEHNSVAKYNHERLYYSEEV